MQPLKVNSALQGGKYKIEEVLGQGGFGITYLATQALLDRKVCIKEFFFREYCERDETTSHVSLGTQSNLTLVERFMGKFLKEARTISQLDHPNIIRIYDIFKENNTAYYVMEYIEGESLSEKVKRQGALSEREAINYIQQVATALNFIHQRSINHLDVKPANIMIRRADNKIILIDFGLSKQYDAQGEQTSTTPVGISHGYAPMEQYNIGGVSTFSPRTDIYSLGATLYKLVTGDTPPQASDILNEGLPELPTHLSVEVKQVITQAMQPRKKDRPETMERFLNFLEYSQSLPTQEVLTIAQSQAQQMEKEEVTMILNEPAVLPEVEKDTPKSLPTEEPTTTNKKETLIVISAGIIVLSIILFLFIWNNQPTAEEIYNEGVNFYTEKNFEKAIYLFEKAAKEGHADAQCGLAICYYNGEGIKQDYEQAFNWWKKAAEKGDTDAQYGLAICYYNGEGVKQNNEQAFNWWKKAAVQGDAYAQHWLAICYYNGNGVKQDYEQAFNWWKTAAEQGVADAQHSLGLCYYKGEGVKQDNEQAFKWLKKAAEQGHTHAKQLLEKLQ